MDRKCVDFNLSVLTDWSLDGYLRSILDEVCKDKTMDDKYNVDFISKFGQASTHDQRKREPDRKKILDEFNDVLKQTDREKREDLSKSGTNIDRSNKVITEQELSTFLLSVRQAEFRRLIKATENEQSREKPETIENIDPVIKEAETQEDGCLNDVKEPPSPILTQDSCTVQDIIELPTLPIVTTEVVKHTTKKNIFRRIGRWFTRLSCSGRGKKAVIDH